MYGCVFGDCFSLHQTGFYGGNGIQSRLGDDTDVNSSVFLDVAPYYPVEVRIRFGRTYSLHLQGRRVNQISCLLLDAYFLGLLFDYKDSGSTWITELHGVTTKNTVIAVRISNPHIFSSFSPNFIVARSEIVSWDSVTAFWIFSVQ
jgi:hypothetical protein